MKYIVLDVGGSKVSALELETKFKGFEIMRYEETSLPLSHLPPMPEQYVRVLSTLLQTFSLQNVRLVTGIPQDAVTTKIIDLPFKDKKKISQTYLFELEEHIPFAIDQVSIDYEIINQVGKLSTILSVMTPHNKLIAFLKTLEAATIDPDVAAVPQLALASLSQLISPPTDCYALVDMGHFNTNVALFMDQRLASVRVITSGGFSVTSHLKEAYDTSLEEAQAVKQEKSYIITEKEDTFNADQQAFSNALKGGLQPLLRDLNQTFVSFRASHKKNIKHIYLTGRGGLLRNLPQYITQELQIETERLNILGSLQHSRLDTTEETEAKVLPSLSLALQQMLHFIPINFRKGEFAKGKRAGQLPPLVKPLFKIAAAILLILSMNVLGRLILEIQYQNKIDSKINSILTKHFTDIPESISSDPSKLEKFVRTKKKELETKLELFGDEAALRISPLHVLDELSKIIANHPQRKIIIKKLIYSESGIRIEGITDSEAGTITVRAGMLQNGYFQVMKSDTGPIDPQTQQRSFVIEFKARSS